MIPWNDWVYRSFNFFPLDVWDRVVRGSAVEDRWFGDLDLNDVMHLSRSGPSGIQQHLPGSSQSYNKIQLVFGQTNLCPHEVHHLRERINIPEQTWRLWLNPWRHSTYSITSDNHQCDAMALSKFRLKLTGQSNVYILYPYLPDFPP